MLNDKVQIIHVLSVAFMIVLNFGLGQASLSDCKCALFEEENGSTEPIIATHLPASMIKVSCNDVGEKRCQEKCNALGKSVPENLAAAMLCQRLGRSANFKQTYLFASICDTGKWIQTGLKFDKSICCNAGQSVRCITK